MAAPTLYWARLKVDEAYALRRGAWYAVSAFVKQDIVLNVHKQAVTIPLSAVELAEAQPRRWTVVRRPRSAVMLPETWGVYYGVCPSCQHRAPLLRTPQTLRCPRCYGLFAVAWDERYLR